MQLQRYRKPLTAAGTVLAVLVLGVTVLPLLLPFLLAYLAALGAEPGVAALGRRTGLPRWARSGLCVTALFLLVGTLLCFFGRILWEELLRLAGRLPELLHQLLPALEGLRASLEALAGRAPESLSVPLTRWIGELFAGGAGLLESLYGVLSGLISALISGAPRLFLGLVTTVIASYMSSAALPRVKAWLRRRLPAAWQEWLRQARDRARSAFGGWCRAQAKLLLLVFVLLSLGLWLLGTDFPLLFGGLIALLDALPVLGTGTVLIPWSLLSFLQEDSVRGFGLLVLYGLCSISRSVLEPHLVGKQLGMPPLLTLMAFYIGYRLFGILGMLLLPLVVLLVKPFLSAEGQIAEN
ncbi:MAG: sporulation integral membrane protein YtvI [Oscillospiraceae bacterium]|nr:sporulation integral membrane protein YtvI [Oscillospiraceae bacterium]